jgi:hypothetical protein
MAEIGQRDRKSVGNAGATGFIRRRVGALERGGISIPKLGARFQKRLAYRLEHHGVRTGALFRRIGGEPIGFKEDFFAALSECRGAAQHVNAFSHRLADKGLIISITAKNRDK